MKTLLRLILAIGLLGSGIGATSAADSKTEKDASPTIKERLTNDTILGVLMKKMVSITSFRPIAD